MVQTKAHPPLAFVNARLIDPEKGVESRRGVLVEEGLIKAFGADVTPQGVPRPRRRGRLPWPDPLPRPDRPARLCRRARRGISRDHRLGHGGGGRRAASPPLSPAPRPIRRSTTPPSSILKTTRPRPRPRPRPAHGFHHQGAGGQGNFGIRAAARGRRRRLTDGSRSAFATARPCAAP